MTGGNDRIKVVIRVRPFNVREHQEDGGLDPAFVMRPPGTIDLFTGRDEDMDAAMGRKPNAPRNVEKSLGYDHVFGSDPAGQCFATQKTMFEAVGLPIVENALDAYNGCAFFYGQTGSGKSFSCVGDTKAEESKGILPRTCEVLFERLQQEKEKCGDLFAYQVIVTYLEIYNEKLIDLLSQSREKKDLQVRVHPTLGPHVPGLTESPVASYADIGELLDFGAKYRVVAATNMNAQSSRSHAIFSMDIRINRAGVDSHAKVDFVDLAGSERQKKTGVKGEQMKEGIAINQSLTALGKVISALTSKKTAVPPFRDSKLTLMLKECLSGNSRTVLVACVSPSAFNFDETVSTLDFASRCKMIATSSQKNEVDRRDQIEALEAEKLQVQMQLRQEQEAKQKVLALVEEEKQKYQALELEMAEKQTQLAASMREEYEDEQETLKAERNTAQEELEQAKQRLEQARGEDQKKASEALKRLEEQEAEKESIRKEREAALEELAKAGREQEQMLADHQAALRALQEERARLASVQQSEALAKNEMQAQVEKEAQEKEAIRREREQALEQANRVRQESSQILAEREAAVKSSEEERERLAKMMEAEASTRAEIEAQLKRLQEEAEQERQRNEEKSKEVSEKHQEMEANKEQLQRRLENLQAERALAEQEKARLEGEAAEKEALRKEREQELEQVTRARQEQEKMLADREDAFKDLQAERERLAMVAKAESKEKENIKEKLKSLEADQAQKEQDCHKQEEELRSLVDEMQKKQEEVRAAYERAATAEQQQQEAQNEVAKAQRERDEAKAAKDEEIRQRIEELRKQKEAHELQINEEFELALQKKTAEVEQKELEMQDKIKDLQSRVSSLQTSNEELEEKASEQREMRQRRLKLAGGAAGLTHKEREACPRIANLNKDPFLHKTLVFYIPADPSAVNGEGDGNVILVGSGEHCQIQLEGLGIGPEVCRLRNEGNESVFITAVQDDAVKVRGKALEGDGQQLADGDRIALGESYIFELEIPAVRKAGRRGSIVQAEEEFDRAMAELDEGAELDKRWKAPIESASFMLRQQADSKKANDFLKEATSAGKAVRTANYMLSELPPDVRGGVESYDLSVILDSGGQPVLCVVVHRKEPGSSSEEGEQQKGILLGPADTSHALAERQRQGAYIVAVWTLHEFLHERLHRMEEAHRLFKSESGDDSELNSCLWGAAGLELADQLEESDEKCQQLQQEVNDLRRRVLEAERRARKPRHDESGSAGDAAPSGVGGFLDMIWGAASRSSSAAPATAPDAQNTNWVVDGIKDGLKDVGRKFTTMFFSSRAFDDGKMAGPRALEEERVPIIVSKLHKPKGSLGVKTEGKYITEVDQQAMDAGWEVGDKIVSVNGKDVESKEDMRDAICAAKEQPPIRFEVVRKRSGAPPCQPEVKRKTATAAKAKQTKEKTPATSTRPQLKPEQTVQDFIELPTQSRGTASAPVSPAQAHPRKSCVKGHHTPHAACSSPPVSRQPLQQYRAGVKVQARPSLLPPGGRKRETSVDSTIAQNVLEGDAELTAEIKLPPEEEHVLDRE